MAMDQQRGEQSSRPRERLFAHGAGHLQSAELLAVVLGSGIAGAPAEVVAGSLVENAGGIHPLSQAAPGELIGVAGIGRARAARVVAAFELGRRALTPPNRKRVNSPYDVYKLLRPRLAGLEVEVGVVLGLSARNDIAFELEIGRGEPTSVPIHPREVFRPLIRHGTVGGIFVHNHPSGDPTPSCDDIALTHRLVTVGDIIGIPLIDHIVIAAGGYRSLATELGEAYRQ